jgi:4-aminobutyrate aminotransferase/(S)-3-amino-2-methylpropionate transaminase
LGRTGRLFAFEHYGIVPDLICCGKGLSSSLPLSAVIGRAQIMDQYGPAEMTSTHTGNPVCAAAALASVRKIAEGGLVENAQVIGEILFEGLEQIRARHYDVVGAAHGRGLVAGLHMVRSGGKEPDGDLAFCIVEKAFQKGLVGPGGGTVKIAPPLMITEEAIQDGLLALSEAIDEATYQTR